MISSVDQSIQPVAETAVRIYADLDNPDHELRPGLKATMTIILKPEGTASYRPPRPVNQANAAPTGVGVEAGGPAPTAPLRHGFNGPYDRWSMNERESTVRPSTIVHHPSC